MSLHGTGQGGMETLTTTVYDAAAVPSDVWYHLRKVHLESLKSEMPREEWDSAATITGQGNPDQYEASRINPDILVGNPWHDDQIFRQPQVAVLSENGQVVGGVLTANNASGDRLPKPLRPVEQHAKMHLPPQLDWVPIIGGRRYVHLREAFVHPDVVDRDHLRDGVHANRVALTGLWHALGTRHSKQIMTAYVLPDDPADHSMTELTRQIDMTGSEISTSNTLPGYQSESSLWRVTTSVAAARAKIEAMIGSSYLRASHVEGVTVKDVERAAKAKAKQLAKDLEDERRRRHEMPGK